jgi:hypothetical protein
MEKEEEKTEGQPLREKPGEANEKYEARRLLIFIIVFVLLILWTLIKYSPAHT